MRGPLAAAFCLLLAGAPLASGNGVPIEGSLETRGSVVLHGSLAGLAQVSMMHYDTIYDHGIGHLNLSVPSGRLYVFNQPSVQSWSASPANSSVQTPLLLQELRNETFAGSLDATTDEAGSLLRVLPSVGRLDVQIRFHGTANLTRGSQTGQDDFIPNFGGKQFSSREPAGNLQTAADNSPPVVGNMQILVYGASINVHRSNGSEVLETGRSVRSSPSSGGLSGTSYIDDTYAIIVAQDATLDVAAAESLGWHYAAVSFDADFNGDASFEASSTTTTLNHTQLQGDYGLIQIIGNFHATAEYGSDGSSWHIDGTADYLALNAQTIADHRAQVGGTLAGGLGIAALAILALRYGRDLMVLVGLTRTPRLDTESRQRIRRFLEAHPAATAMDLARGTGYHRSTVTFHLAVLRRAGLLHEERDGAFRRLLTGGPHGTSSPLPDAFTRSLLAHLRNPIRHQIVQSLFEARKPLTYQDVSGLWVARHGKALVGRTTFAHHARKLERSGILHVQRIGKKSAWTIQDSCRMILLTHLPNLDAAASSALVADSNSPTLSSGPSEALERAVGRESHGPEYS